MDRIDLHVGVAPVSYGELSGPPGEPSSAIATRVRAARERQVARFGGRAGPNAELRGARLREATRLEPAGEDLLSNAMTRMGLTARGHDRLLRVARTIADLEGDDRIRSRHLAEALQFRPGFENG